MNNNKINLIKKIFLIIIFNIITFTASNSEDLDWSILEDTAEITNVEWNSLGMIQITIYETDVKKRKGQCTAFYIPKGYKPVGGGFGFFEAGIAQVTVDVPRSFARKDVKDFRLKCITLY